MRTILEEQFTLKKVKRVKNGGLEIHWEIKDTVGQETYYDESNKKSSKEPHEDLMTILRSFAPEVGKILKLNAVELTVKGKEFGATEQQIKDAEKAKIDLYNRVRVNGIAITGMGENRGAKILAVYQPDTMQALAVNPGIRFNTEVYGFESEIEDKIALLEKECYLYLFDEKRAQLDLFDEVD